MPENYIMLLTNVTTINLIKKRYSGLDQSGNSEKVVKILDFEILSQTLDTIHIIFSWGLVGPRNMPRSAVKNPCYFFKYC